MLEALFELIFSFIGEFLFELVVETLVEVGFHKAADRLSNMTTSLSFVVLAYTLFGFVLGFASLYIFPKIHFGSIAMPVLYFVLSPVAAGFSLSIVSYIIQRGIDPVRWFQPDKFLCGVLFAVAYSVARVLFG